MSAHERTCPRKAYDKDYYIFTLGKGNDGYMKRLYILFIMMIFLSSCATPTSRNEMVVVISTSTAPSPPVKFESFGIVTIAASDIEFVVRGDGDNIDSIGFWEASEPTQSLMFVTSKNNSSIEVYQYPFNKQQTTISCGQASNGVWIDQENNILYITERKSSNVCAYDLPALDNNDSLSFTTAATSNKAEPNLTMLNLQNGQNIIYVSYDNTVFYHDAGTGKSLGQFKPSEEVETMYGDDYYQVIYIPDERQPSGIYLYDPNGESAGSPFGGPPTFQRDAEGISVYKCRSTSGDDNGEGLIIVSDQKGDITDFEVFNRKTKAHLGTINIHGVKLTDGIAITQQSSPAYPFGLLVVVDDDTSTVGVGLDTILEKTGLSCGS
jgi:myo-inositol-hexaphosphate 3-phosphohydrolase